MPSTRNTEELTRLFELLGAEDPADWAASQVDEGIPQLAMFVFLKRASRLLGNDGLNGWLSSLIHGRVGDSKTVAAARSLSDEEHRKELLIVLRQLYQSLLMEFCCLLDNTSGEHFDDPHVANQLIDVDWRLFAVDTEGKPVASMSALHELLDDFQVPEECRTKR